MGEIKHVVHPFSPIYDENSEILILGSFPSVISREKNFYYANKNNRFWKVMSILFQEDIQDKVEFCLKHHIALWDVIHSCEIIGSSDSSISNVIVNDIESLISKTNIRKIFFTGKKAEELYKKYIDFDIAYVGLPSTSSANAKMHLDDLIREYQIILETLNEKS